MRIEQRQVGTVEVLTPVGALVDDDAEVFRRKLQQRTASPNARLVVCMQEVPYMDSAALEALVDAADEFAARASTLKLSNLTPICRETLELTGLAGKFRLFKDVEDAVRSFL